MIEVLILISSLVILKDLVVTGQFMGKFALELVSVVVGLVGPLNGFVAVTVARVVLVVASFHMSVFINEAPWTLGIFVFLVMCSVHLMLIVRKGCLVLNIVPLLVVMVLVKVDEVIVLGVMLIGHAIVSRLMGMMVAVMCIRPSKLLVVLSSAVKSRVSVMHNLLS